MYYIYFVDLVKCFLVYSDLMPRAFKSSDFFFLTILAKESIQDLKYKKVLVGLG